MFTFHLIFIGNSIFLVEQLLHFAGGVRHELNFEPALFHVHADFVVYLEAEDLRVHFLEQRADDAGHDHELVGAQVDVRLHARGLVQHLNAAQVVTLEGFHAFGVLTFRKHY